MGVEEKTGADLVRTPGYDLDVGLEQADQGIKACLTDAARNVIAVGYYLKVIRDREFFRDAGYRNIWEYAWGEYGFSKSTASRYMARNDRFSVGGNSPVMAEAYREYSRAQLQEMLSLDAEQMELVTPEMTVREIRELKRPKEIPYYEIPGQISMGEASLEDFLGAEEPETVKGSETPNSSECSSAESCTVSPEDFFPVSQPEECIHRQGFACTLPEEAKQLPGTGADCSAHCCWDCVKHGDCRLECYASAGREGRVATPQRIQEEVRRELAAETQQKEEDCCENRSGDKAAENLEEPQEEPVTVEAREPDPEEPAASDMDLLRRMLAKEQSFLEEMLEIDQTEPLPDNMVRKKKLLVGALAGMLCDLEGVEEEETEQPELPMLKNNDQRKEWLQNYQEWGIWYIDDHIGCRYYRYDFDNGARLVVDEYDERNRFTGDTYVSACYHLVGGPEPPKHPMYGTRKWVWHEKYSRYPDSMTELVEFLKAVQKDGEELRG